MLNWGHERWTHGATKENLTGCPPEVGRITHGMTAALMESAALALAHLAAKSRFVMNIPWENKDWVARMDKAMLAYQEKFGKQPHLIFLFDEQLPERLETAV